MMTNTMMDMTLINQPVICSGGVYIDPAAGGWCFGWCVTPETMITLADGTQKRVDEVKDTDRLMVYDFDNGCIADAPITFFHRMMEEAPVAMMTRSNLPASQSSTVNSVLR